MFLFTIFIIKFAHGFNPMGMGGGYGGGMGGMGMGPPIIPNTMFYECEGIPLTMCNLQKTMGKCAYLPTQKKCDLAEKCGGRGEQGCSLYWSGTYQMPNCVWLQTFGKCDESTKCQGRSQFLCTHPSFPGCHWAPIFPGMAGSCSGSGFSLLAETHTDKSEPIVDEQSETHKVVEPVLEASSAIVDSAPQESPEVGALIGLASGSFFVGLFFTFIILRCKQQRTTTEEVLDFNYTLEPDTEPTLRRI